MTPKHDELEEMALMRLIKMRKARKLTQTHIGEKIGLGVSQVSRIESGEARLTVSSLLAYCEALSVSPSTIVGSEALDATSQGALSKALAAAKQRNTDLLSAVLSAVAILKDAERK